MAEIPDVIQAKAFQLVDDSGNVTAELKTSSIGTPAFALRNKGGNVRLMVNLNEDDEPVLILYNKSMELRYFVGLDEIGEPVVGLFNGRYQKITTAESYEKRPFRQPKAPKDQASSKGWWRR